MDKPVDRKKLQDIAKRLKNGVDYDDLEGEVDKLLGLGSPARDRVAERMYEEEIRA